MADAAAENRLDARDVHAGGCLDRDARREGSAIHTRDGDDQHSRAPAPKAVVDPTGCGDAYRAGLLHGLLHGLDWETTGRIASLMGAIKIEARGTQNHSFTRDRVRAALRGASSAAAASAANRHPRFPGQP